MNQSDFELVNQKFREFETETILLKEQLEHIQIKNDILEYGLSRIFKNHKKWRVNNSSKIPLVCSVCKSVVSDKDVEISYCAKLCLICSSCNKTVSANEERLCQCGTDLLMEIPI